MAIFQILALVTMTQKLCACCLRPYPQEQFIKILAPGADDYITLQRQQLENISNSVIHQVEKSDQFQNYEVKLSQMAEIIDCQDEKIDKQKNQFDNVKKQISILKQQFNNQNQYLSQSQLTQILKEYQQSWEATMDKFQMANDQKLKQELLGLSSRIEAQDTSYQQQKSESQQLQQQVLALKVQNQQYQEEIIALKENQRLILQYFDEQVDNIQNSQYQLAEQFQNSIEQIAAQQQLLNRTVQQYDSLKSSYNNPPSRPHNDPSNIPSLEGKNSSDFQAFKPQTASSSQQYDSLLSNKQSLSNTESMKPFIPQQQSQAQLNQINKYVQCSTNDGAMQKSFQQQVQFSEPQQTTSATSHGQLVGNLPISSNVHDSLNITRSRQNLTRSLNISEKQSQIMDSIRKNEQLIEKYSNLSLQSTVQPKNAGIQSQVLPKLKSPDLLTQNLDNFQASQSLSKIFNNILKQQSKLSNTNQSLAVSALNENSVQTENKRKKPENVLEKGKQLIDKVDNAFDYLNSLPDE